MYMIRAPAYHVCITGRRAYYPTHILENLGQIFFTHLRLRVLHMKNDVDNNIGV